MSKITKNTFVVVADGHHDILFRNSDGGGGISLAEDRRFTPKNLSADGLSGSRPEDQTPKQTDEATFAKQLVLALQQMHRSAIGAWPIWRSGGGVSSIQLSDPAPSST